MDRGVSEYQKQAVNTASPLQLVLMLYDAALKHCEAGKRAIRAADLQAQSDNLCKAQRVVSELIAGLDLKQGGDIAQNLFALYSYCLNELAEANINDQTAPVDRCILVLSELREAWQQLKDSIGISSEQAA